MDKREANATLERSPSRPNPRDSASDHSHTDIEFVCNSDIPPAVPNGEYELSFLRAAKRFMWKRPKVFLWFRIVSHGEWFGRELYMACNVAENDKWTASCKFYRTWVLAAQSRPNRRDRMSTGVFRNKIFRGRVKLVTTTAKQDHRTPEQQYSVIDELLEIVVGAGCQANAG